jgi:hypothetical protein
MRMIPESKFTEWAFCKQFYEPKPIAFEHPTTESHPFTPRLDGTRRDSVSDLWHGFVRDGADTTKSTTRGFANIDRLIPQVPAPRAYFRSEVAPQQPPPASTISLRCHAI